MKNIVYILTISLLFSSDKDSRMDEKMVFVYNSKSGFINGIIDYVHKFVSPATYSCNLCGLTYDNTGRKNEWADYLNTIPIEVIFAYKDNVIDNQFGLLYIEESLPCVFLLIGSKQVHLITSQEIDAVKSLEEFMQLVSQKLLTYQIVPEKIEAANSDL